MHSLPTACLGIPPPRARPTPRPGSACPRPARLRLVAVVELVVERAQLARAGHRLPEVLDLGVLDVLVDGAQVVHLAPPELIEDLGLVVGVAERLPVPEAQVVPLQEGHHRVVAARGGVHDATGLAVLALLRLPAVRATGDGDHAAADRDEPLVGITGVGDEALGVLAELGLLGLRRLLHGGGRLDRALGLPVRGRQAAHGAQRQGPDRDQGEQVLLGLGHDDSRLLMTCPLGGRGGWNRRRRSGLGSRP